MFDEGDVVRVRHAIAAGTGDRWPGTGTTARAAGECGTVVAVHRPPQGRPAFEIEFVDPDGTTKALLTLTADDIDMDN